MSLNDTGGRRRSDLPVRAATGIAMIAVAASALWLGGIWFWLLCVVGAIVMLGEFADLVGANAGHKRIAQFSLSVPLATMAPASLIIEVHYFLTLGLLFVGLAIYTNFWI